MRATCNDCRNKNLNIKKRKRDEKKHEKTLLINDNKENAKLPSQLSNIIYENLLEIGETNEFLMDERGRFIIGEILYLEPLLEEIPITLSEDNKSKEIANRIIALASEGDGY